jgi:hypothetical protein
MSDNKSQQREKLERLLDQMGPIREQIENNPAMKAALLAGLEEERPAARQKVLAERGIEPSDNQIDREWLEAQLEEGRIDVAMVLFEASGKAFKANVQGGFKALGLALRLALKVVWMTLTLPFRLIGHLLTRVQHG